MREERGKNVARLERIAADYPSLLEHFGLTPAAITDGVKGLLS